jgi:hypothetical protein
VMIVDGMGRRPMNSAAYKLLSTNERREVALNAENWDRFAGKRPEVIIPLPAAGNVALPRETVEFLPGQTVLITRAPYQGMIGALQTIRSGMTVFPNGVKAQAGDIQLENGDNVVVPLENLEVLV